MRIPDLRSDKIALSLSAHQLGVSAVQMDDWKVVSGGEEGLVSVWDYRMNRKLWEVHSRYAGPCLHTVAPRPPAPLLHLPESPIAGEMT